AMAVPGNLSAWCETHSLHGSLPLAVIMRPAIRHARYGFRISHYMAACISDVQDDLRDDPALAHMLVPGGSPLKNGDLLVQAEYARTLERIARNGIKELTEGELGQRLDHWLRENKSMLTMD